jgi:hypothetical protein
MKLKNMLLTTSLLSISALSLQAQVTTQNQYGKYTAEKTTVNVSGSPYLTDDWASATIKMKSGLLVKEKIKYNLLDDILYFKSADEKFMTFAEPVSEFRIEEGAGAGLYRNNYDNSRFGTKNTFYQVLFDGKVKLLKRLNKGVNDVMEYNAASPTKTITQQVRYYAVSPEGTFVEVKPNKKDLLAVMEGKKAEVEKFLSSSHINFKSDADLVTLFTHYNSLM